MGDCLLEIIYHNLIRHIGIAEQMPGARNDGLLNQQIDTGVVQAPHGNVLCGVRRDINMQLGTHLR